MSGQSEYSQSEGLVVVSGISHITSDFIGDHLFIRKKIKNGKANCDKCKTTFPCIHPMFVVADDASEEILCYPCNYKKLGIDVKELYKSKRSDSDLQALRLYNRQTEELKASRKKKKDVAIKVKKEVETNKVKTPDLFSGSIE